MSGEEAARFIEDVTVCLIYLGWGAVLFVIAAGLLLFGAWLLGVDLRRVELPSGGSVLPSVVAGLVIAVLLVGAIR